MSQAPPIVRSLPPAPGTATRARGWPMQAWVALLVFAVTLPLGGLLFWNAQHEASSEERAAADRLEQVAAQTAAETDQFLDDTRLLLERISMRPAIRAADRSQCDPVFADFGEQFPRYAALLLLDASGSAVCGSTEVVQDEGAYAQFGYFKAVAAGKPFHVDPPRIGRSTQRWIVGVAVPVLDGERQFAGALAIGIDLAKFPLSLLHAASAPGDLAVELVTRDGQYVARSDDLALIGAEAPPELANAMRGGERRLTLPASAGIAYVASLTPVRNAPWWAVARLPAELPAAAHRHRLERELAIAALALLGVWAVATLAVRRMLSPLDAIARAAKAVAAGDADARVRRGGPREIDEIAATLNRMLERRARDESALRASEARYRALFETSTEAIVGIADDGRIAFANPAIERLTGWKPDELVGERFATLQRLADRAAVAQSIELASRRGDAAEGARPIETRCLNRDGREVPVEMTFGKTDVGGSAVVIGFLRDISERHAALAGLRESEQRFRTMADSSSVLIWTADAIAHEFYFNATWLAFTGQTLEEARRDGWYGGVHPDDLAAMQPIIDRANERHEGCTLEYRRRRHDGEYRWVIDTSAPRFDDSGRFLGYVGSAVDIHDRVTAESRILSVTRLYSALSRANEAIARSTDLPSLLETVCDIVVRETGIRTAVVALASADGSTLVNAAASGAFADYFAAIRAPIGKAPHGEENLGSVAFRGNCRVVSNDRERDPRLPCIEDRDVRAALRSTAVFPLRRHSQPVGILAVYSDQSGYFDSELTDLIELLATDLSYALEAFAAREHRERAEEALRRLNVTLEERVAERTRSLEAANRELEAFSYSVSHDLRAPLRGVSGFSELLHDGYARQLDDTGRSYLARVKAAAAKMARLIDDLLNLSRIARQTIHRDDVDVSALARDIVDELREGDRERSVDVHVAPGLVAHADPGLTRIALANLLDNAWKFTSRVAAARIEVTAGELDRRPGFTVRDNGAGFDPAYADKLFAPFQRLHGEREFPGTGIGLAIVQRIVHRHGGEIRVTSTAGAGAAFTFTLGEGA